MKIYFKETEYEYFSKINQILPKEIRLKSAVNESSKVILNWSLYHDYPDIFLTQITPEELKAIFICKPKTILRSNNNRLIAFFFTIYHFTINLDR